MSVTPPHLTRRHALIGLGASGMAAALAACSKAAESITDNAAASSTTSRSASSSPSTTRPGSSPSTTGAPGRSSSPTSTPSADGASCTITPELTEGPYYLDLDLVRQDIRDGRPGTPLKLKITAVDSDGCTPLTNAAVDLWHCDASGAYSGVSNAGGGGGRGGGRAAGGRSSSGGQTPAASGNFLRGTQITNDQGVVEFVTIYPGAYSGRAVHIHFKVHPDANREMTGQFFVPDELSAQVYADSDYANSQNFVKNSRDSIFGQSRGQSTLQPTPDGDGYAASFTVGVSTSGAGGGLGTAGGRRA